MFSYEFPSPLGVIFSLIQQLLKFFKSLLTSNSFRLLSELYSLLFFPSLYPFFKTNSLVSVSSRSYILSYMMEYLLTMKLLFVSVSSRSYILSYIKTRFALSSTISDCFRLLSELYSLL